MTFDDFTPPTDSTPSMPDETRRALQAHADVELDPRPRKAREEIEKVFRDHPDAVLSVSGGKDSMAMLGLAADSDARHRVFHWDWGARLVPREIERQIVENIREYVPDSRFFVASRKHSMVKPFDEHDSFRDGLHEKDGIDDPDGSLDRLAGVLSRAPNVGLQLVAMRKGESGSRDRQLDGLYGESLGQQAAFPLRDWTGRDVWAFIVDRDVPYLDHYDRVATGADDGSPGAYADARFTTFHDPEFEELAVDGIANWRHYDITIQEDDTEM